MLGRICRRLALGFVLLLCPLALARGDEAPPDRAIVVVTLPRTAKLEIDGDPTTSKGPQRTFETAKLEPDTKYSWTLVATWTENGEQRTVSKTVSFKAGMTVEVLFEMEKPRAGLAPFGKGDHSGEISLTVENGTKTDAVVKLIRRAGKKEVLVRNFYLPKGSKFTAKNLPEGTYVSREAYGSDWDAETRKFTKGRSFAQSEELVFKEGYDWTMTLHGVLGGNLKDKEIKESEFDDD